MPTVILRGGKHGRRVSRVVLEGSSSNPTRYGDLNGEPFEVTDEEFAALDQKYVLEQASGDAKQEGTDSPPTGGTEDES